MNLSRRSLLGVVLAAPAIIRTPGLLMPVKRVVLPSSYYEMPLMPLGDSILADYPVLIWHHSYAYEEGDAIKAGDNWYRCGAVTRGWV